MFWHCIDGVNWAWGKFTKSRFAKTKRGATAIEYGLIAAGVAVAIAVIVGTLGTQIAATFQSVVTSLGG